MFSLRRLLGRDEKFYDLLEASAEEAKSSITLLSGYLRRLEDAPGPVDLDEFIHTRRTDKRITQQIAEALSRTFVTPMEREDIDALASTLYRIPKTVEKIVERLSIYPGRIPLQSFHGQAKLLEKAVHEVSFMVGQLRRGTSMEKIRAAQDRLQAAEGEADKLMLETLKELYQGPCDAKQLIILRELHEMLEKVVDRCRDAGNVIVHIVLKYS